MKKHIIKEVVAGSIAEELELAPGDALLAINGQELEDIFDYQFLAESEELTLLIEKPDHEQQLCEIEKDEDEDIGIVFEKGLMDDYRRCCNNCIFCFIDQNPKGLRESLYFKDDDSRLSFLQGNYVTLTNMSDKDIDRIIRYHLSPINISVHTMDPALRCRMLGNRFAGEALKKIDRLFEAQVPMNGQIVLCKGYNDGEELARTLEGLMAYQPYMESVSVVPVGLTKFREGLTPLEPFDREDAAEVLETVHRVQEISMKRYGVHFVHASDEWYIMAGVELPEAERYDGYLQLENGVGMTRLMIDEFQEYLACAEHDPKYPAQRSVAVVTGVLHEPVIRELCEAFCAAHPDIQVQVVPIVNHFFGERITVTGLLTGTDLKEQLSGRALGDELLLPNVTLRRDLGIFLDDVRLDELEKAVGVPIRTFESGGYALYDALLGR